MNRLMVDIETLGVRSDAVITAVGAVAFNSEGQILGDMYAVIRPEEYRDAGYSIDLSTVFWWMQQSENARKAFAANIPKVSIAQVISDLETIYRQCACEEVWANGTDFDFPILGNMFYQSKSKAPWRYNAVRDYRTLRQLYPEVVPSTTNPTAHDALADARYQTNHLIGILRHMGKL